jgi:hypothetical protein
MRRTRDDPRSYRAAAILFSTSGAIFLVLAAVGREVGAFLPIGIALIVLSMGFWKRSRKPARGDGEDSSD